MATRVLVTGAGGFIGHHLVTSLVRSGHVVRGVDVKYPEYEQSAATEFELLDLGRFDDALIATRGVAEVYHLGADMGGIGYISASHADVARKNAMINLNTLEAARLNGVNRLLFSSTACVYPQHLQRLSEVTPLKEEDAHPADPEEGYGWEKLFMEKLCQYYREDYRFATRVVRFHNVYGPLGAYAGGREKVPAAICRKVAMASDGGEIEVWGDGEQSRSFMYIDDCVEGVRRVMRSDYPHPLNLGSEELVTINQLVDLVAAHAGKRIIKRYNRSKPQGVRGRSSDNTRLRQVLGWEPRTPLKVGLYSTYRWVESELRKAGRVVEPTPSHA